MVNNGKRSLRAPAQHRRVSRRGGAYGRSTGAAPPANSAIGLKNFGEAGRAGHGSGVLPSG
jgi:hypothetical protein